MVFFYLFRNSDPLLFLSAPFFFRTNSCRKRLFRSFLFLFLFFSLFFFFCQIVLCFACAFNSHIKKGKTSFETRGSELSSKKKKLDLSLFLSFFPLPLSLSVPRFDMYERVFAFSFPHSLFSLVRMKEQERACLVGWLWAGEFSTLRFFLFSRPRRDPPLAGFFFFSLSPPFYPIRTGSSSTWRTCSRPSPRRSWCARRSAWSRSPWAPPRSPRRSPGRGQRTRRRRRRRGPGWRRGGRRAGTSSF